MPTPPLFCMPHWNADSEVGLFAAQLLRLPPCCTSIPPHPPPPTHTQKQTWLCCSCSHAADNAARFYSALKETPWAEHVKIVLKTGAGMKLNNMNYNLWQPMSSMKVQTWADISARLAEGQASLSLAAMPECVSCVCVCVCGDSAG